jgi:hypothetical protein
LESIAGLISEAVKVEQLARDWYDKFKRYFLCRERSVDHLMYTICHSVVTEYIIIVMFCVFTCMFVCLFVDRYIDKNQDSYIARLKEAVAIKSVSSWPETRADTRRMVEWTKAVSTQFFF